MRILSVTSAALAAASLSFFSLSPTAHADVAPDPCDTLDEGDACEDLSGDPGICVNEGTYLYCDAETGTGGDGQGGSNAGGSSSGGSSSGGSGTGGSADTGGTSEDDSCTVSTVGASGSAEAAALLALLGACFAFRNKRRVRRP